MGQNQPLRQHRRNFTRRRGRTWGGAPHKEEKENEKESIFVNFAVIFGMLLVACGGSTEEPAEEPATTEETTTEEAVEEEPAAEEEVVEEEAM
jgi:hypothetical protein